MKDLKLTPEQIEKSINAAYDSVNLINYLKEKESLSVEDEAAIKRNEQHIEYMLGKDWFSKALTPGQKIELESINNS